MPKLPANLTDKLEALVYIHGASTLPEFAVRAVHILLAHDGQFPEWWDDLVLESGELERLQPYI